MPLFGPKTGFRARMNEIKSGIPCPDSNASYHLDIAIDSDASVMIVTNKHNLD
jgi:hypothetical protein